MSELQHVHREANRRDISKGVPQRVSERLSRWWETRMGPKPVEEAYLRAYARVATSQSNEAMQAIYNKLTPLAPVLAKTAGWSAAAVELLLAGSLGYVGMDYLLFAFRNAPEWRGRPLLTHIIGRPLFALTGLGGLAGSRYVLERAPLHAVARWGLDHVAAKK